MNAQDFPVDTFLGSQNLQLFAPASVSGHLTRGGSGYAGRVSVRLAGASALIPGRERVYGGTLTLDNSGAFARARRDRHVFAPIPDGGPDRPAAHRAQRAGRSGQVGAGGGEAARGVGAGEAQRRAGAEREGPVAAGDDSGRAGGGSGDTVAALSAGAHRSAHRRLHPVRLARGGKKDLIGILALPRATSSGPALLPQRAFTAGTREPLPVLELGDFGKPVTVSGKAVGSDGNAIAGATVYLDGKVQGGGTFTSASVKTDSTGAFTLHTLASYPSGELSLWVVPPATSLSGQVRTAVTVTADGGFLREVTCPDRVPVQGQVRWPDGRDFPGVKVVARAVAPLDGGLPPPSLKVETTTNENSQFTLHLDPAVWQLDFIPPESLPLASRQVTVRAELLATGGNKPSRCRRSTSRRAGP